MPDVIRHPAPAWIPAAAGMTKPDMFNCRSNKKDTSGRRSGGRICRTLVSDRSGKGKWAEVF